MQAPGPDQVAAALERVYTRSEFVVRETPWLARLIAEAWQAIRRWFWEQLGHIPFLRDVAPWLPWLVVGLLAVLAAWALTHVLAARPQRSARGGAAAGVRVLEADDAAAWETAARQAMQEGRYRDAAHALFHATVLRLQEHGAVRYHSGKTPGEYRREIRGAPPARAFEQFVMQFLPVAFGAAEPDATAVESLWQVGRELGVRA